MSPRRSTKKPVKKRRSPSPERFPDIDSVLLRCTTIERRLDGIEAVLNIHAQRMSIWQEQLDRLTDKRRPGARAGQPR